jgi:hypothetical protein
MQKSLDNYCKKVYNIYVDQGGDEKPWTKEKGEIKMGNEIKYMTLKGHKTIKFNSIQKVVNKFNEWSFFKEKNVELNTIEELVEAVDSDKVIIRYIGEIK